MKSPKTSHWEGLITTFIIILTVLFGTAYVIAWNYRIPIPWLLLLVLALLATFILNKTRHRRG